MPKKKKIEITDEFKIKGPEKNYVISAIPCQDCPHKNSCETVLRLVRIIANMKKEEDAEYIQLDHSTEESCKDFRKKLAERAIPRVGIEEDPYLFYIATTVNGLPGDIIIVKDIKCKRLDKMHGKSESPEDKFRIRLYQ